MIIAVNFPTHAIGKKPEKKIRASTGLEPRGSKHPPRANSPGKNLVATVHHAQQIDEVKQLLWINKTLLTNIPPGCTRQVQP